jgi:hypothetical protein
MKRIRTYLPALLIGLLALVRLQAAPVRIDLVADEANPAHPKMGDNLEFHSVITNESGTPVAGLVAWISLVEIDPGHEQPMDLEDWSAQKAVAGARLASGGKLETTWPIRLIKSGDYRVVVSCTSRGGQIVSTSPTREFHVAQKRMIESTRILPVALGIPLLLLAVLVARRLRQRQHERRAEA